MIERWRAQRSFGDGLIAAEVADLHEVWMRQADRVLDDPQIVALVYEALAQRQPQGRNRGRPGAPAADSDERLPRSTRMPGFKGPGGRLNAFSRCAGNS